MGYEQDLRLTRYLDKPRLKHMIKLLKVGNKFHFDEMYRRERPPAKAAL